MESKITLEEVRKKLEDLSKSVRVKGVDILKLAETIQKKKTYKKFKNYLKKENDNERKIS